MTDIDKIMEMLDWNNPIEVQNKGIELAENIESINVFIQPCNKNYNKNVWGNCAEILSRRTDEELSPYLVELLEWLQDLNWPGAYCILDRLKKYADEPFYNLAFNIGLKYAKALDDDVWESNLRSLKRKD